MKHLNRNQWIGVAAGLGFVGYLFYGGAFVNLFNQNNPSMQNDSMSLKTGVQVSDVVVGNGDAALAGDVITVHYVGSLTDGKVFDSSLDRKQPITFTLGVGQVIRGWDEGVAGMRVGGRRKLLIAPDYGYGENGIGPIPPSSTLIFEVELLKIEKPVAR
ncbi:MAG: FK506-binding protein 2 [Parcubacteria bacterium C7867-005]|nr:MAG: FK506-binding protein 2 [Parcubacteria bacterium C7867-005]